MQTPDFDSYPSARTVTSASPTALGIEVVWDDGLVTQFHALWLRENAPDPETTHADSREQRLQLVDIDPSLRVIEGHADDAGGLVVRWSSGESSRFHPGWLRAWAYETNEAPFALPARRLWDRDSLGEIPRFQAADVLSGDAAFEGWCRALHVEGCAIIENAPAEPGHVTRFAELIGPVRESNFGQVFDVRTSTEQTSLAYTAMELPVHADLCTREHMPGLQFLHCIENETDGGASLLADGFEVVRKLAAASVDDFEALTTIPLVFYNKAVDSDYRCETPLIGLDAHGEVREVRFSPWLRAPVSAPAAEVDRVYRALRHLFSLAEAAESKVEITLRAGELLAFDNARLLHGRRGFDSSTGARWLQGCYGEREELHSALRIIARQKRRATTDAG